MAQVSQHPIIDPATEPFHEKLDDPGFLSTELTNTATHAVGLGLSIAGLAVLVVLATEHGTARHIVACSIYGATLVGLYLASTLYHTVRIPRLKRALRLIDHSAIFLLIAGTYTPFTVALLNNAWGWSLFGLVWGLAALGIVYKLFYLGRLPGFSLVLYLAMGWMAVIGLKPLAAVLPVAALGWLFAGGVAYTLGCVFFAWERLPHHHAIWHLFVMVGSACHFFTVMYFVLPRGL
jgi:hemolysin III